MFAPERQREIVAVFQAAFKRDNSSDIESISLAELRDTDAILGNRDTDAGFRIAIRNRIKELEELERRTYASRVRTVGYIVAFCIGVLATVLASYLLGSNGT